MSTAPERIWLLDYGSGDCSWCDCPDPDFEDHEPVEYVRADTAAAAIEMWRQLAQAGEARSDETTKIGSARRASTRSRRDAPR